MGRRAARGACQEIETDPLIALSLQITDAGRAFLASVETPIPVTAGTEEAPEAMDGNAHAVPGVAAYTADRQKPAASPPAGRSHQLPPPRVKSVSNDGKPRLGHRSARSKVRSDLCKYVASDPFGKK